MNHNSWLAKADELREGLERVNAVKIDEPLRPIMADRAERERLFIARWLRQEFSEEQPEDRATLMFPFDL